jgi:hypothetical protein
MQQLVYISCCGHSGGTILDLMLSGFLEVDYTENMGMDHPVG